MLESPGFYIGQVYVVSHGFTIPAEYGVDSFAKLNTICLVNAVGINLEVLVTILSSLIAVKIDFRIAGLVS